MRQDSKLTWALTALAALLLSPQARADASQVAALQDALTLVTGPATAIPPPEVTQDGDQFHIRFPLPKLDSPPGAAVVAEATQRDSQIWDITSVTMPPTGTFLHNTSTYVIGHQSGHARLDASFGSPSDYAIALDDISLRDPKMGPDDRLRLGKLSFGGTITGAGGGRVTTRFHINADHWDIAGKYKTGGRFAVSLAGLEMQGGVDGLDRAREATLRDTMVAMSAAQKAAPPPPPGSPGQKPPMTPEMRDQLRALVDAYTGLASGISLETTLQGLHFEGPAGSGTIGTIVSAFAGNAHDNLISGHSDISLDDMTFSGVPPQYAPIMPNHVLIRTAISHIGAERLRNFIRDAVAEGANPLAMQARAVALLNTPGASAGIETMSLRAGPMRLEGSAHLRPLPDGTAGLDVHLTAEGLDAMIARVQGNPQLAQIMPFLFMAKGMAKPSGDGLVWDISVAHGGVTVNGAPMMPRRPPGGVAGGPPMAR